MTTNELSENIKSIFYHNLTHSVIPYNIYVRVTDFSDYKILNISPIASPQWIPFEFTPLYYRACKDNNPIYYLVRKDSEGYITKRKTITRLPNLLCSYPSYIYNNTIFNENSYFIGNLCILTNAKTPLMRTYIHVTGFDSEKSTLMYDSKKVTIDKSVFESGDIVCKYIKRTLFPIFMNLGFIIEIDDYSKINIWAPEYTPKHLLEDKEENVYKILSNNINFINNLISY